MKRLIAGGCAVLLLSAAAGGAAHADVCAQGKVTSLSYRAYSVSSHDPSIAVVVNGKEFSFGMSADEPKNRMEMSDMRATLLAAMLAGSDVVIATASGACSSAPVEHDLRITVTVPAPGG